MNKPPSRCAGILVSVCAGSLDNDRAPPASRAAFKNRPPVSRRVAEWVGVPGRQLTNAMVDHRCPHASVCVSHAYLRLWIATTRFGARRKAMKHLLVRIALLISLIGLAGPSAAK